MKKGRRLFRNIFTFLTALCAAVFIPACSILEGPGQKGIFQGADGMCTVRGTILQAELSSRTAMPESPSSGTYEVTASNGTQTVPAAITSNSYELRLPYGTWTVTAVKKDSSGNIFLRGSKTVTLSSADPFAKDTDITVNYSQTDGYGSVHFTVAFPSSEIKKVEYILGSNLLEIPSPGSGIFEISRTLSPGTYDLTVYFYGNDSTTLVYRIDQAVNVYSNLTTNTFKGNAAYISSGGSISISAAEIQKYQLSTFFVGTGSMGSAASDSNTGTQFDPFATLAKAVEKINASSLTPPGGFTIIVQRNTAETSDFELNSGKTVLVKSADITSPCKISSSAGKTFAISGGVVIKALDFEKVRIKVNGDGTNNGTLEMDGCKISGNSVADDGGAIFNDTNGTCSLKNCTVSGNTTSGKGGGICNKGAMELENIAMSSNSAASGTAVWTNYDIDIKGSIQIGGDVYLDEMSRAGVTSPAHLLISGSLTGSGTYATITVPNAYYAITTQVLEKSGSASGALAASYMHFAVTDQTSGGSTVKWAVDEIGSLELNEKLPVVYLNSSTGNDGNTGASSAAAVLTLKTAVKRLDPSDANPTIVIDKGYMLTGTTEAACLDFSAWPNPVTIKRGDACNGDLISAVLMGTSSSASIKNVIIDGNKAAVQAEGTSGVKSLVNVSAGTVTFEDVVLKDNVSDDASANGGAIATSSFSGNTGKIIFGGPTTISGCSTRGKGGAIYSVSNLTITDDVIIESNSAAEGGGIYCTKVLTVQGGTIKNNTATAGSGIYHNGTSLVFNGKAQIDSSNDVYLNFDSTKERPITIDGSLSATGTVARLTLPSSYYTAGTKVLQADGSNVTAIDSSICSKFILNKDGDPTAVCTGFAITPDSGTPPNGILTVTAAGGEIGFIGSYTFTLTQDGTAVAAGGTLVAGKDIEFTVTGTDSTGNAVTIPAAATYTISLMQNGTAFVTAADKTLTVPAGLAGLSGKYQVYMSVNDGTGTYDSTVSNLEIVSSLAGLTKSGKEMIAVIPAGTTKTVNMADDLADYAGNKGAFIKNCSVTLGAASGSSRSVRGGSWLNNLVYILTVFHRGYYSPETKNYNYGFRVCEKLSGRNFLEFWRYINYNEVLCCVKKYF